MTTISEGASMSRRGLEAAG